MRRRASPPLDGATQISPPETKAISGRVGQRAGSVRYGVPAASAEAAKARKRAKRMEMIVAPPPGETGSGLGRAHDARNPFEHAIEAGNLALELLAARRCNFEEPHPPVA